MSILAFLFGRKEIQAVAARGPAYRGDDRAALVAQAGVQTSTEALGGLCSHYDRYVRQAALLRCVQLARGDLLPVVASRLNDWVAPIRVAAHTGMETLVPLVPAAAVIDVLPAVVRLRLAKREDHGAWIDRFERAVSMHVPVDDMLRAVQNAPIATSRACFMLLKNHSLIAQRTLVAMALESRADIVVLRTALYMCAALDAGVRPYTKAASAAVRGAALIAWLRLEPSAKDDIALQALDDPSSRLRRLAMLTVDRHKAYVARSSPRCDRTDPGLQVDGLIEVP